MFLHTLHGAVELAALVAWCSSYRQVTKPEFLVQVALFCNVYHYNRLAPDFGSVCCPRQ